MMFVSKTFGEQFTFDTTGNWTQYNRNGTLQTRTHNAANEILTIAGSNASVAHDRNGCMTKVPKPLDGTSGYTLVYDAWNRLISVSDGDTLVVSYMYDARNHRIKKTVGDETRLYYFNQQWQCVEERVGTTVDATWIYGLRYIDDVICRVKNTEVLYALQDPNWNVVAVLNSNGTVAERMTYDSFGRVTFRNVSFVANVSQMSSYNWTKTFTGQVYDVETGLMLYRNRYYHPGLGRFITRDPIGYNANDINLHRYAGNQCISQVDTLGLFPPLIMQLTPSECTEPVNKYDSPAFQKTKRGTFDLPTSINAEYSYPFCWATSREDLVAMAGGFLKATHLPPGLGMNGQTGAGAGHLIVSSASDGVYHGVMGAGPCVGVVIYCPDSDTVYSYHLGIMMNSSAAIRGTHGDGCRAVVCGGDDNRNSRCLLKGVIQKLRSEGITIEGIIDDASCYLGPDKQWYSGLAIK